MVSECGDNGENADLLECTNGFPGMHSVTVIFIFLIYKIEEWIFVVIDIVNADFKDALPFFLMWFDKLNPDIQVMEGFHTETVFVTVIFDVAVVITGMVLKGVVHKGLNILTFVDGSR